MSAPTIECPICYKMLGANIEAHYWEHKLKQLKDESGIEKLYWTMKIEEVQQNQAAKKSAPTANQGDK